jgi:hypothetical protein
MILVLRSIRLYEKYYCILLLLRVRAMRNFAGTLLLLLGSGSSKKEEKKDLCPARLQTQDRRRRTPTNCVHSIVTLKRMVLGRVQYIE